MWSLKNANELIYAIEMNSDIENTLASKGKEGEG